MTIGTMPRDSQLSNPQSSHNWLPRLRNFLVDVIGQVRVLSKAYPGLMHALLFWGMTIQVIGTIIALMQIQLFIPFVELPFPRNNFYLVTELLMDLAGVAIVIGVLMALYRRLVLRPESLPNRWDDFYVLALLLIVPLQGFTTEGLRILAVPPAWANWSPIGLATSAILRLLGMDTETAWSFHYWSYWSHIVIALLFMGSIPFTKLRHLIATPLNIVLRPLRRSGALGLIDNIEEAEVLGASHIAELAPHQLMALDACLQCGRCEDMCPATAAGMELSPRKVIRLLHEQAVTELRSPNGGDTQLLEEVAGTDVIWTCTTCGACTMACPAFIDPVDEIVELRRAQALMTGSVPNPVGLALRNIERQSNPWGLPASDRMAWSDGRDIRILQPGDEVDVLLYVGCALAFDDRNKEAVKALIKLLNATGIDYGILGEAEMCCGETARRLGHEYLFQVLAQENIETLSALKFSRIVAQCPHCFNTLKNEYPDMGGDFIVQHYTDLLDEIGEQLSSGKLEDSATTVTYHDSCYLGRHNNIYEAPRSLLKNAGFNALPEMEDRKADALCCGGGGGQMWMETDADTRINTLRLTQAMETDAAVVATACPYCLLMFDDAIRSTGQGEQIEVQDIAEILASRLPAD